MDHNPNRTNPLSDLAFGLEPDSLAMTGSSYYSVGLRIGNSSYRNFSVPGAPQEFVFGGKSEASPPPRTVPI
jgi:hypothetical protein